MAKDHNRKLCDDCGGELITSPDGPEETRCGDCGKKVEL